MQVEHTLLLLLLLLLLLFFLFTFLFFFGKQLPWDSHEDFNLLNTLFISYVLDYREYIQYYRQNG